MRWDHADRLQATSRQVVSRGTPETTYYTYDASGQRVRKVTERQAAEGATPARKCERIYLGGYEIFRAYEPGGTTKKLERETLHVMDGERRVALVETKTVDTSVAAFTPSTRHRYQIVNHLGSSAMEMDEGAQVITYEEYFPYGGTAWHAAHSATEVSKKRYRYTGKERDEETGLYYHGARYYAPWLGRWTSADPAELVDGPNRYSYARNDPVGRADDSGLQSHARVASTDDPNDPLNYVSFDDFRRGAVGPWTDEGLREVWRDAYTLPSAERNAFGAQGGHSSIPYRHGSTSRLRIERVRSKPRSSGIREGIGRLVMLSMFITIESISCRTCALTSHERSVPAQHTGQTW